MQKFILIYFITINISSFLLFAFDKHRSITQKYRVSENRLHLFSLLGGVVGSTLSMLLFRHKVSKSSFLIKHISVLIVWIVGVTYYFLEVNPLNFLT